MALKYKIHDLAKSFGIPSKELLELIKDKTVSGKHYSTMTIITDEDLEIVFELMTRKAEVPSFAELEASAKPIQITAKSIEEIESTVRRETAAAAPAKPDRTAGGAGEKPAEEKAKAPEAPKSADKPRKPAADKPKTGDKEKDKQAARPRDKEKDKEKEKDKNIKDKASRRPETAQPQPQAQPQKPAAQAQKAQDAPAPKEPEPARKPQVQGGAKILTTVDLSAFQKPQKQQQGGRRSAGQQGGGRAAAQKQQPAQKPAAERAAERIESAYKPAVKQAKSAEDIEASRKAKEMRKLKEQSRQNKRSEKREDGDIIRLQGSAKKTGGDTVVVQQEASLGRDDSGVKKRIVDTRSSNVDIERYNQKYDDLAHAKSGRASEQGAGKQKLTQKSQQYKKGGKAQHQRKRETEAERLKRIALERKLKPIEITIPDEITVGELASRLKMTAAEVIKKFMSMGEMHSINDVIDFDTAYLAATELGAKAEREVVVSIEERIIDDSEDEDEKLVPRSPVVVVMGHVDHGKTSLLDYIRHTHVTAGEAGGITQHIGAYRVNIGDREITFLDTPGHEAFTTMRARGAQVTDIAVLVIAADDGIMPQTVEAINHAKMAGVSIIVAINKMDKQGANPAAIMQQLTEYELLPEAWGGDVICCPVSAKTGEGVDALLENIVLVADMKELKANPDRPAKGTVIEARLDKGRGPIATVLVQNGTLRSHDVIVAGMAVGRVRAMTDEHGREVESAGPSIPVEITGLDSVPHGGDVFNAVSDERLARELVEQRRQQDKEITFQQQTRVTLDNVFAQMKEGDMKELKIIVKADVQGSVEAVRQSLEKLSNDEVRVHIIHGAVGAVNESDVMLADASNAIIVGFNVRPDAGAAESAARAGVDMRLYRIIYDCIEEIESALKGMLAPKTRVVDLGRAEVRQTIKISNIGTIAGSYVVSGRIERRALIRVVRDGIVIAEDQIKSLRRFKDDVKEVQQGYECGIGLEKFNDIKEGDFLEAFIIEEYRD